jgi:sphinganine C4-monooxygenase
MVFSDEYVAAVVPILVYWGYSGVHAALGHGHVLDKYRLNTKAEEDSRNTVSKRAVLANVLMQHLMQLVAVILLTPVSKLATANTACTCIVHAQPLISKLKYVFRMQIRRRACRS